jgi:hypothetical protein
MGAPAAVAATLAVARMAAGARFLIDAFSRREPVSTSLEDALLEREDFSSDRHSVLSFRSIFLFERDLRANASRLSRENRFPLFRIML